MFIREFVITNITCEACIKLSTMVLEGIAGVTKVAVGLDGQVLLEATRDISWDEIVTALKHVDKEALMNS